MGYSNEQIDTIFTSHKAYSDDCDAYVELGLKRIYDYYESIDGDLSFCDSIEIYLININSVIDTYIEKYGIIPDDLIMKNNELVNYYLLHMDKTYMNFLYLIDKESDSFAHKRELLDYLDINDKTAIKRIKKYLYQ